MKKLTCSNITRISFTFFLISCISSETSASITTVTTVCDGLAKYTDLNPTDLLVFDLDNTLIKTVNQASKIMPLAERIHALTDPSIPTILNMLHAANIRSIALTHAHTGTYRDIKSMEEWRAASTSSLGVFFSDNHLSTKQCLQGFKSMPPVYYKGIILTAHHPKGPVLLAFLQQMKLQPKRIFFFDDQMRNIHSVQKSMKNNTEVHCFYIKSTHC